MHPRRRSHSVCLSLSLVHSLTFYGNERSIGIIHRAQTHNKRYTFYAAGLYYTVNYSKNCTGDGQIRKTGQSVVFRKEGGTLLINNTRHAEVPYGRRLYTRTKVVVYVRVCVCMLYNIRRIYHSIVFRGFILCI